MEVDKNRENDCWLYCEVCDDEFFDTDDLYSVPEGMKYGSFKIPICPLCGNELS